MRCIGFALLLGIFAVGQEHPPTAPAPPPIVTGAELHWTNSRIPNLQMAVVSGDPASTGPYVLRLRATQQTRLPAHWHPADESVTVIRGMAQIGMGDRFATDTLRQMQAGDYVFLPAKQRSFGIFNAGTEVQVHGEGPYTTNWVHPAEIKALNPSDVDSMSDRSKKKAADDKR